MEEVAAIVLPEVDAPRVVLMGAPDRLGQAVFGFGHGDEVDVIAGSHGVVSRERQRVQFEACRLPEAPPAAKSIIIVCVPRIPPWVPPSFPVDPLPIRMAPPCACFAHTETLLTAGE